MMLIWLSISPLAEAQAPVQCETIYGVHDKRINDTQIFAYRLQEALFESLGNLQKAMDIEGLDVHPQTNVLYASSGKTDAQLFTVDSETGALSVVGNIGYDNVVALAFHPDGTLWGWSDLGLLQIDVATGLGTLMSSEIHPVQALTWNQAGTLLYATANDNSDTSTLLVYDGNSWQTACEGLPKKVEALETDPEGLFIYGFHTDNQLGIHGYDVSTCKTLVDARLETPFNDIEGIAWPDYPCVQSNLEALITHLEQEYGEQAVRIEERDIIVTLNGEETHYGQLAESIVAGMPPTDGKLVFAPIDDANNDGSGDFLITYPSGDQQVLYYFGTNPPPRYAGYFSIPAPNRTVDLVSSAINQSVTENITITETGEADLTVDLIAIDGTDASDFSVVTDLPLTIADGENAKTLTVECIPSQAGFLTASLQLSSNDPNQATLTYDLQCQVQLTTFRSSPVHGEGDVAVTRETIIEFSRPLAEDSVIDDSILFAEFGGQQLPARIHLSPSRQRVTLFYPDNLPASARIRVTLDTRSLRDDLGQPLDVEGDRETEAGLSIIDFDTLTLTTEENTSVCGRVFASELAVNTQNGQSLDVPLEGVTISVDGMEDTLRTGTDASGNFCLTPAPAGRFFVHIDGRTASNGVPDGAYYPFVGKAWESKIGEQTNLGNIYLPLVTAGTLQPVSETEETVITFSETTLTKHPHLAGVSVIVPADSLYANDSSRGGKVGIAPVPPDRIPGQLPPGLNFPLVITVQTDGATNFDEPLPACFPNLPNSDTGTPLPAGSKSALWSFNHDTGKFEVVGPMTVTADGLFVCTDPGVGIKAPGWHGTQPGTNEEGEVDNPENCGEGEAYFNTDHWSSYPFSFVENGCYLCTANRVSLLKKKVKVAAKGVHYWYGSVVGSLFFERFLEGSGAPFDNPQGIIDELESTSLFKNFKKEIGKKIEQRIIDNFIDSSSKSGNIEELVIKPSEGTFRFIKGGESDELFGAYGRTRGTTATVTGLDYSDEFPPFEDNDKVIVFQGIVSYLIKDKFVIDQTDYYGRKFLPALGFLQDCGEAKPFRTNIDFRTVIEGSINLETGQILLKGTTLTDRVRVRSPELKKGFMSTASGFGNDPTIYYRYVLQNGVEISGKTSVKGTFSQILPPNTGYVLTLYSPKTNRHAVIYDGTGENGSSRDRFFLLTEFGGLDTDGDEIPDVGENAIGTNPEVADTDGDGISDSAEIIQGTNPLDGLPAATGKIATADTPGTAVDICAINDMAFIADSGAGISIFNVFDRLTPTIIAQVNTPGNAQAVTCASDLVAVADGSAGLAVIDITDPPAAQIIHQVALNGSAQAVAVAGNMAYVGTTSGQLVLVDLINGTLLNQINVGGAIQDVAIGGDTLYVLTVGELHTLSLLAAEFEIATSISSPGSMGAGGRRFRLFIGDKVAYTTHTQGYNTFDLTNPLQPTLIAAGNTRQFGWKQIVDNGSGLGIAAVSPNSTNDGRHHVSLYDVSNPAKTNAFITQFETPGLAAAVSIYNGLAYVADSTAGLQVINYLAYDTQGESPTISLSTNLLLANKVEEGKVMRVTASVNDDVQVRNVAFYVDGEKVVTDGNFPFEHRLITPSLAQQENFTVRACASDTGGNSTCSEDITITITPDATPPYVTDVSPRDGTVLLSGMVNSISATFSEPMAPNTLNNTSLRLFSAGPDGVVGNGDDVPVTGVITYYDETNTVFLTLESPLPIDNYRATLSTAVTDLTGNHIPNELVLTFRVIDASNEIWVGTTGGNWNEASNWSRGTVPDSTVNVFIQLPGDETITISSGEHHINNLYSDEKIVLSGGTLQVTNTVQVNNEFILSGGTLMGATVIAGKDGQGVTANRGTLNGVTMEADMLLTNHSQVTIKNGLTLNSTATLGLENSGYYGILNFEGTQTLDGTGTVVFANHSGSNGLRVMQAETTLTIASDITIRGATGLIGYRGNFINHGRILADVERGTITLNGNGWRNDGGTIKASEGTTIRLAGNDWHYDGESLDVTDG
ncbi:MAG: hypothetical protein DRR19_18800, partial [Candidatus Parabeggiatoa sp. nov. 1]